MRVLLDECVDSRLAEHIRGHAVSTAAAHSIAVVLISSKSNRIDDLMALVPALLASIEAAPKGAVTRVGP